MRGRPRKALCARRLRVHLIHVANARARREFCSRSSVRVYSMPTSNDPPSMRFRPLAVSASLLIVSSVGFAQTTTTVKITAPSIGTAVTSGAAAAGSYPAGTPNFYVSPYAGLINYNAATNSGETASFNCIDYFHHVRVGDVWTANVTNLGAASSNLGLLGNTRYGNFAGSNAADSYTFGGALNLYKQAAWLTLQYDANPGSTPNKTRAIQSAIWSLFNNYDASVAVPPTFNGPGTNVNDSAWWLDQADNAENQLSTAQLQYFSVITDNTNPWAADSKQEFLVHATPEPSTVLLMATGMIALVVVVRRRRAGAAAIETA